MSHYHIHWSGKNTLDWESHGSRAEAEARATELVRPGETYIIEEHDKSCSRCAAVLNVQKERQFKYPWQQAVSDAFTETHLAFVPWKVNAAQRAISARLCHNTSATPDEQIAIREALQSLRALIPEPKKDSDRRHEPGQTKATA